MKITVRPARLEDVDSIVTLGEEFLTYLRLLGDPSPTAFNPHTLRQDGFGPTASFSGLVAALEGNIHGYLLYHPGYDIDHGGRVLCLIDLYVRQGRRFQLREGWHSSENPVCLWNSSPKVP